VPWGVVAGLAAAGAIGGAAKAHGANQYADKQNKARLQELRYKPFGGTDVRASTPGSSMFGEVLGGAVGGANLGMAGRGALAKDKLIKAQTSLTEKIGKGIGKGASIAGAVDDVIGKTDDIKVPGQEQESYYSPHFDQYSSKMIEPQGGSDESWEQFLARNPVENQAALIENPQTSRTMARGVPGADAPMGEQYMPATQQYPSSLANIYSSIQNQQQPGQPPQQGGMGNAQASINLNDPKWQKMLELFKKQGGMNQFTAAMASNKGVV